MDRGASAGRIGISTPTTAPAPRGAGTETTDAELVAAVRAGDDRAFERLYSRYHRRIASYIYGMVHDYARAEDIAQDVFMSALRRMRDTDRPIAFKPWIYEIAKNACIDQFRRSRRAEEVSYDADDGLGAGDYGRLVSGGPAPDAAVATKQDLDHLRGAFGGLSETHHEILVMRELEGLSYREIGARLGMSRPSVESTLFRARRRLTEEYRELVTGERCVRVQAIIATVADGGLGARDRRRMARHLTHCQPCRRQARLAGIDPAELAPRAVPAKIAAFLPLPAFLRRRLTGEGSDGSGWTSLGSLDPALVSGWGKAAATAATVALAGVGAGMATSPDGFGLSAPLPGAAFEQRAEGSSADARVAGPAKPAVAGDQAGREPVSQAAPERTEGKRQEGAATTSDSTSSAGSTTVAPGSSSSDGGLLDQVGSTLSGVTSGGGSGGDSSDGGSVKLEVPKVEVPAATPPATDAPKLSGPDVTESTEPLTDSVDDAVEGTREGVGSLLVD